MYIHCTHLTHWNKQSLEVAAGLTHNILLQIPSKFCEEYVQHRHITRYTDLNAGLAIYSYLILWRGLELGLSLRERRGKCTFRDFIVTMVMGQTGTCTCTWIHTVFFRSRIRTACTWYVQHVHGMYRMSPSLYLAFISWISWLLRVHRISISADSSVPAPCESV